MRPWSCDTFVAMPDTTTSGATLLGKNSDRPAGETQPLRHHPRRSAPGGRLRLAYLEIEDCPISYAHVAASPYWCWGHELGLNEWGVAIGNEALFTRDLAANVTATRAGTSVPPGILGMELVRLGLERATTATQAVDVMTELIESHGQWGSGVPGKAPIDGAYDNSYLIADARQAWVLETSGQQWAARRITAGTYAISNQPTLRTEFDRSSHDLRNHAVTAGWWPQDQAGLDFARAYADPQTPLQASHVRLQRSRQLLANAHGGVDESVARRILRDHYEDTFLDGPYFNAALPDLLTLCMHEHPSGFTWGNTASSAVFVLPNHPDRLPHLWWTPATPCTGVYLPVFIHAGRVPDALTRTGPAGSAPTTPETATRDTYDQRSYWWRFQQLLDVTKTDELAWTFTARQAQVRSTFDRLENQWAHEVPAVEKDAAQLSSTDPGAAATLLAQFTESCADQAVQALNELITVFGHDSASAADARWAGQP